MSQIGFPSAPGIRRSASLARSPRRASSKSCESASGSDVATRACACRVNELAAVAPLASAASAVDSADGAAPRSAWRPQAASAKASAASRMARSRTADLRALRLLHVEAHQLEAVVAPEQLVAD